MAYDPRNNFMSYYTNTTGGAGNLPGTATNYSPVYGGVPGVPNPTTTASTAIGGNAANLPGVEGLAGGVNKFQEQQLLGQYGMAIPNYAGLTGAASGVTSQELAGKLPQDVINQITQQAAERGITTGSPGSPNQNSAYLAALGLNSLGMQQQGFQNLHQLSADAPIAQPFNVGSMFVTPQEQQEAQYMASLLASAPVPGEAANKAEQLATVPGQQGREWWMGSYPGSWLGAGTTSQGGVYHTPAAAG